MKTAAMVLTEKPAHCSICAFYFAKDSDAPLPVVAEPVSLVYPELFHFFKSRVPSSVGLSFSDRGPPAASA